MIIAVDAMGGDHAPQAVVEGALLAEAAAPVNLILTGDEYRLRDLLGPAARLSTIQIAHAAETVGMEEAGPVVLRTKKKSSLSVAMRLLGEGKADALVSAGNSAAVVATGKHYLGLLPGLRRPAIAIPLPTLDGQVLLLDGGAHDQVTSIHLAQCAILADAFLKATTGISQPRLGLLNIGTEPAKGPPLVQGAFALLERLPLCFVGNVEPHQLLKGDLDAVICDGFVGNVLVKTLEGLFEFYSQCEHDSTAAAATDHPGLARWRRLAARYHYERVGGAPLLGVRRPVVMMHGRSRARAVANAIALAQELVAKRVYPNIAAREEENNLLYESKRLYTGWMLGRLKDRWGLGAKTNQA